MGAPFKVLDDATPLAGDRVDVAVRVGWTLRMARLASGGRAARGFAEMSALLAERGVSASVSTLHRLESGQARLGHVVTAYEDVLGLPAGALRAPIDITCRTFAYSPPDRGVDPLPRTVEEMDALVGAVDDRSGDGTGATGGAWLAWARAVVGVGGLGVPGGLMRDLVARLLSEMGRASGTGYHARYEALALLRRSDYGTLVLEVARDAVAEPHVQVLYDLMSVVGESVTPDARDWAARLLLDERDRVSFGASLCLENMLEVGGDPSVLVEVLPQLVEAFEATDADAERWSWLSHLVRLMPPGPRAACRRAIGRPLAPTVQIPDWSRTSLNEHWTTCEGLARDITDAVGLPPQPLLARMLFEIAMGPHESRAVTASMLLCGIPGLGDRAGETIAALSEEHPDPLVRDRVARRLIGLVHDQMPHQARPWLSGGHERVGTALLLAGSTGTPVDESLLRQEVGGDGRRAALYAAGMTGAPLLGDLLDDPDPDLRGGAAWWRAHGTRVPH